ncbi:MAG: GNAT family N-acetyltransferase [Flavobacteriales bacterium]|nr:GNAT family N-acetyltransferase [Flavobacteriales bacterium]
MMNPEFRFFGSVEEMMEQFPLLKLLTPGLDQHSTTQMLREMIQSGYRMLGLFEGSTCLGLSGIWVATKLYSGKYLEIDNFVTHPDYRSKGIGKLLIEEIERIAQKEKCKVIMLDAYTVNTEAHRFYFREGFVVKGFHFIKTL